MAYMAKSVHSAVLLGNMWHGRYQVEAKQDDELGGTISQAHLIVYGIRMAALVTRCSMWTILIGYTCTY